MQLSRDTLRQAYRLMPTIRAFEDRVDLEMATGDVPGNVHLYAGHAVGVCLHLGPEDRIGSTHRRHSHSIAKGCDVHGMMAEIFGRSTGTCRGKGGSMHIADLDVGMLGANGIVGGSPPLTCGAVLTPEMRRTGGVAVAFTVDGGVNQGTTAESVNLARVWVLPVIFVVEDNGFGEATLSRFAVASDIVRRAEAFDMPARRIDGTDFFAVHAVAGEAVARGRAGEGSTLLHVIVPRYYGHFSCDADSYRTADEEAMRSQQDCLAIFCRKVGEAGLLQPSGICCTGRL